MPTATPQTVITTVDSKTKHSRSTFYTALRFATGHSFNADYTRRFEKDFDSLDVVICECGYEERAIPHILYDSPLFL